METVVNNNLQPVKEEQAVEIGAKSTVVVEKDDNDGKEERSQVQAVEAKAKAETAPEAARHSLGQQEHYQTYYQRSLFDDAIESAIFAANIFSVVLIRKLAKEKLLPDEKDCEEMLKLPIDNTTLRRGCDKYAKLLGKFRNDDFLYLEGHYRKTTQRPESSLDVYYVGDELAHEECVHAIGRDHYRKQIFLVFRGSITPTDWYQDFKLVMSHIPNPVQQAEEGGGKEEDDVTMSSRKKHDQQQHPEKVGIHLGFRNYMYGPPSSLLDSLKKILPSTSNSINISSTTCDPKTSKTRTSSKSEKAPLDTTADDDDENNKTNNTDASNENNDKETENDESLSKIQVILQQLHSMKKLFPSDRIFVAGHSLGGALALITSLSIAADPILGRILPENKGSSDGSNNKNSNTTSMSNIVTPVTCIAVGNPKPGDGAFSKAIEYLERQHKLKVCCIHNHLDIVPLMPTNVGGKESGFWHPGFRILLYKDRLEIGRGDCQTPLIFAVATPTCCGPKKNKRSKWAMTTTNSMSKMTSSTTSINNNTADNDGKSSNDNEDEVIMTKRRLNIHNYSVYLDRILRQKEELFTHSLPLLYQQVWKGGDNKNDMAPAAMAHQA